MIMTAVNDLVQDQTKYYQSGSPAGPPRAYFILDDTENYQAESTLNLIPGIRNSRELDLDDSADDFSLY